MGTEKLSVIKRLPKKLWHLGKLMVRLARVSHAYLRTTHSYKMKIAKLEQERDKKLEAIKIAQQQLIVNIFSFADGQKGEITKRGKSVTLATGQVGWREIAPSVEIESGSTEKTVAQWLATRYRKYLRFTPRLNKEQILQDHRDGKLRKIKGLRIRQGTEFFISLAPRGKQKPETITIDVAS